MYHILSYFLSFIASNTFLSCIAWYKRLISKSVSLRKCITSRPIFYRLYHEVQFYHGKFNYKIHNNVYILKVIKQLFEVKVGAERIDTNMDARCRNV